MSSLVVTAKGEWAAPQVLPTCYRVSQPFFAKGYPKFPSPNSKEPLAKVALQYWQSHGSKQKRQ